MIKAAAFLGFFAVGSLAACSSPISTATGPTGPEMPPLGLAATAVWLDDREALIKASETRAAEVLEQEAAAEQTVVLAASAPVAATSATASSTARRSPGDVATDIILAGNGSEVVATIFVEACLKTASNPNDAKPALLSLGFKEGRKRGTRQEFKTSFATASLSDDTRGGGVGQCTVTPKAGNFQQMVPEFRNAVTDSGVSVRRIPNEEAYVVGDTGAVALISRSGAALTRTQPGVFRSQ